MTRLGHKKAGPDAVPHALVQDTDDAWSCIFWCAASIGLALWPMQAYRRLGHKKAVWTQCHTHWCKIHSMPGHVSSGVLLQWDWLSGLYGHIADREHKKGIWMQCHTHWCKIHSMPGHVVSGVLLPWDWLSGLCRHIADWGTKKQSGCSAIRTGARYIRCLVMYLLVC